MEATFPPRAPPSEATIPTELPSLLSSLAASAPAAAPFPTPNPLSSSPQYLSSLPRRLVGVSTKAYFTHARMITYVRTLLHVRTTTAPHELRIFFIPSLPGVSTAALLREQAAMDYAEKYERYRQQLQTSRGTEPPRKPLNLLLGAQDCHFAPAGAHTGSVPASELAELGCSLVELGHAERRRPPLNESDEMTAAKARMAVAAGLVPLVCIGERTRPDVVDDAAEEVRPQIETVLRAVGRDAHVVFAYEPVWAIGQAAAAPPEHVCAVADRLRAIAKDARPDSKGDIRIIYGGSAGPGIWEALKGSIDGLFLGRFAHDVHSLAKVADEMAEGEVAMSNPVA